MSTTVPDTTTCLRLMEQYGMLPHIRKHSIVVARVAEFLVDHLPAAALPSTPVQRRQHHDLVIAGALLHDIAKTLCLDNSCDHARRGAEICTELGFPEIARIVEEHVILKQHEPHRYARGIFTAREIVYYADKRVRHDEIVTLRERLDYIIGHYGRNDPYLEQLIHSNFNRCLVLEEHLFSHLDFPAHSLPEKMQSHTTALAKLSRDIAAAKIT